MGRRGPKPKQDAVRRGGAKPELVNAEIVSVSSVDKPVTVSMNPTMDKAWDWLVGASPNFKQCDAPLLEAYVTWYVVFLQAQGNIIAEDGSVHTMVAGTNEYGDIDQYSKKAHPDIATMAKATDMLAKLGSQLNLSPVARDRAGLMQALTKSTQADVVNKTLAGFEEFKRLQGAKK